MVQYCCKRHQRDDWPQHKPECKAFRALGLRATFYRDEDMLAAFPLQSHRAARSSTPPPVPAGASCPICGKGAGQAPLTRTPCCQQLVCDTNARYQIGSFSRDICPRSLQRYTLCG
uniref:MYND-type domain-containing protein n=1 Tax=Tetradesmus obliquus TaxID=3088 RepID=A0A383W5K5_TETOB|eukprot:jgi/Sobl393_1/18130/SZX72908.1